MNRMRVIVSATIAFFAATTLAVAQDGGGATTRLRGFDEVPALSTPGGGRFHADLGGGEIAFELSYFHLKGNVTQAHLHMAQRGVNGGIVVFLCSNLGNGPAGTPACPADGTAAEPAVVSGVRTADDVVGPAQPPGQGIAAGEMGEVLRALRAGVVYVNVHTDLFPGGEIRGQLKFVPGDEEGAAELVMYEGWHDGHEH